MAETRKRRKSPEPRPGREASRPTPARGAERVPRRARSRRPGAWGPQCPATAPVDVLQEFNKTCVFALKGHLRTYKDVQFLFEQKANKIKRPRVTWKTTAAARAAPQWEGGGSPTRQPPAHAPRRTARPPPAPRPGAERALCARAPRLSVLQRPAFEAENGAEEPDALRPPPRRGSQTQGPGASVSARAAPA